MMSEDRPGPYFQAPCLSSPAQWIQWTAVWLLQAGPKDL